MGNISCPNRIFRAFSNNHESMVYCAIITGTHFMKKGLHMQYLRSLYLSAALILALAAAALAEGFSKELGSAIADGDIAAVQTIISGGADINASNKDGETPLMIAALEGRIAVVKFLVEKGAHIDSIDGLGATPLLYAAEGGSLDVITFLVEKGADPTAATKNGDTALTISRAKNNRKAVDYLKKIIKTRQVR